MAEHTAGPVSATNGYVADNPLLERFFQSSTDRVKKENGKRIIKAFYQNQTSNSTSLNFFRLRNARYIELLLWAKGSQKMAEFLPLMGVDDANKAWLNIDTEQSRVAAKFVGTLVESMSKNRLYAQVDATDDGSVREKEDRLFDSLFRMHEIETIKDLQDATGMAIEPPNAHVPDDEMAARVYYELVDRLPKEIRFEKYLQWIQNQIKFDLVANKKSLFFLIVLGMCSVRIDKVAAGEYVPRIMVPTNTVYNFFMGDTGEPEVTLIGDFTNVKVKDFRRRFGKTAARPDGMDEKEIFDLAKLSAVNRNVGTFNYMWDQQWAQTTYFLNRPYDDFSIFVLDVFVNCGEDAYFVDKKDQYGRSNITPRSSIPYQQQKKNGEIIQQAKPDDVEIIKGSRDIWMQGIYAPYGDKILLWEEAEPIIPNFTDTGKSLCPASIVIPFNDGEYMPSLFERIMEPLREYQLTKMERKKMISLVKPSGIRIDVSKARNIDLGSGDSIPWLEVLRIYNQTGVEIYSSEGVDPLMQQAPALANPQVQDRSIEIIIGLTNTMNAIMTEIRELIGVPSYRDGADVGDRTAAELAQSQNKSSFNVTDHILDYNMQLWQDVFYKMCLLKWNDIVKSEPESKDDMLNTRFDVKVKMKLTDYQKELLEQDIQRFSQMPDKEGNPLLSPKDAIMLREIEDYKLACMYLDSVVNKNRRNALSDIEKQTQLNAQQQQQSSTLAAQQASQIQDQKLAAEKEMKEYEALQQMKVEIVRGSFLIASKGETADFPEWLQAILPQLVPNIVLPIQSENKAMGQQIMANAQQEQMAQEQQQQQPQGQPQDQSQNGNQFQQQQQQPQYAGQ